MRFSIGRLMGFVMFLALGFGGLKAATPLWASCFYTLAFASLIAGVLVAIQARGRRRAFWLGFSIGGWAYFALALLPPFSERIDEGPPRLLTAYLLEEAEALMFSGYNSSMSLGYVPTPGQPMTVVPSTTSFSPATTPGAVPSTAVNATLLSPPTPTGVNPTPRHRPCRPSSGRPTS